VVFTSIERGLFVVDPSAALERKAGIDAVNMTAGAIPHH